MKEEMGAKVVPLTSARQKYWRGHEDVKSVRVVRKRFLAGSLVTFAFSAERESNYWNIFFRSFSPMIRIGWWWFAVDLAPIDAENGKVTALRNELTYRMRVSLLACVLAFFGFTVSSFAVQLVKWIQQVSGDCFDAIQTTREIHYIPVSSVQPYMR